MTRKLKMQVLSLQQIIRKNVSGKKLTADEAKQLAGFRRRNPAWSKVCESRVNAESAKLTVICHPKDELQVQHARSRMVFETCEA